MQLPPVWMKQNITSNAQTLSEQMKRAKIQGNIDGFNPEQRKATGLVAVTPLVTFFEIALTRCTQGAKNLLGENFSGILNSDRHGAYNWVDLGRVIN